MTTWTHEQCPRDHAGPCDWTEWAAPGWAAPLDEHRYCRQCGIDEWREADGSDDEPPPAPRTWRERRQANAENLDRCAECPHPDDHVTACWSWPGCHHSRCRRCLDPLDSLAGILDAAMPSLCQRCEADWLALNAQPMD